MVFLQKVLPRYRLTLWFGKLGESKVTWLKNSLILGFIKLFHVNLDEAELSDYRAYRTFNAFFSRKLIAKARPINADNNIITSPVDGYIYHFGKIGPEVFFVAKGFEFTLETLLSKKTLANLFQKGCFCCQYLSPSDYHRVHMPCDGQLLEMIYVPGDHFSVNPKVLASIPGIFAKNERIVCVFKTAYGLMSIIMVGAMNVASLHTVWAGAINQPRRKKLIQTNYAKENLCLKKGDEIGFFQMGSTVISVFADAKINFSALSLNQHCLMGQKLGRISSNFSDNNQDSESYHKPNS